MSSAASAHAAAQQYRHQFRGRERMGAARQQFFARTFVFGPVANAHRAGSMVDVTIIRGDGVFAERRAHANPVS